MQIKELKLSRAQTFFQKLSKQEKNICFLHGFSKNAWPSLICFDPVEKFTYKSGSNKKDYKKFIARNSKKGRKIIGYFSYDLGYDLYKIKKTAKDDLKLPDIFLLAFDSFIIFENQKARVHYSQKSFLQKVQEIQERKAKPQQKYTSTNFKATITAAKYKKAYQKIKNYIKQGDIYQINLTHRLEAKSDMPARVIFNKIITHNKVDFLAYIEGDGFEVLSASPERFIKIKNRIIDTFPIKGTRPRSKTPKRDQQLKKELLESEKEAAELNMITDLLRNDIGKISEIGTVRVIKSRIAKKYPTVWHTYSHIQGTLRKNLNPIDALISMLPGGSITGCPKKRAMQIIDELESSTRNIYTGAIGVIDSNQDLDFSIAIRSIIKQGQKLHLQVGGGIVLDSTEKAEFDETLDKAKSFMNILK